MPRDKPMPMVSEEEDPLVEFHENPNIITFHVRERLTDCHMLLYKSRDWAMAETADDGRLIRFLRNLSLGRAAQMAFDHERRELKKNAEFVDALFRTEGVVAVTIYQYAFSITKGHAFMWEEVRSGILNVCMSRFVIPKLYGRPQV